MQGNLIATYAYDEWGRLLSIETAEEDNAEQLEIAETNPLRYRGYYYDNETGMYYLQSRYYNPELCRFISADDFDYISNDETLNLNAYAYCWNCPVAYDDIEGTTPELSINLADIISFIKNINNKIKEGITAGKEKLNKLFENWTNSIKTHYNAFIDKLEYFINYPDAVINNTLSKIFNREINIRFRLVEFIREKLNVSISLSKLKADVESSDDSEILAYSASTLSFIISDDEKTDNWLEAALKVLSVAFEVDFLTQIFSGIIQIIQPSFDYNNWYNGLSRFKRDYFDDMIMSCVTAMNTIFAYCVKELEEDFLDEIKDLSTGKIIEAVLGECVSSVLDFFDIFNSMKDNFDGNHSIDYSFIATFVDVSCITLSIMFPMLTIGFGLSNELIKQILLNIEKGKIFG